MNIKNNKRRQLSQEKIEKVFIELLQNREITQISVSDICKRTGLNRSTFYANYADIYDLADHIRDRLEQEVDEIYENDMFNKCGVDYLPLFRHIRDNQIFYKTYFKLGYDRTHTVNLDLLEPDKMLFPKEQMRYHITFHKAGLNAVINTWLDGGCLESPEVMSEIIKSEYENRH